MEDVGSGHSRAGHAAAELAGERTRLAATA
jgi:hypothetical protein